MMKRLALCCGAGAAIATFAALGLGARRRHVPLTQPVNAAMHVLDGPSAGSDARISLRRTGGGAAINLSAAMFWGSATAGAITLLRPNGRFGRAAIGAGMAGLAGLLDYRLLPRRLSPGWELTLPPRDVRFVLAVMGIGMAVGAVAAGDDQAPR